MVATFPQLEYPRAWAAHVRVAGPLLWELPAQDVELPPGSAPLVLVAPSTSQDRRHRLLDTALRGLAALPVRVLATYNRRTPEKPLPSPANARVVEWVSYARTMPAADVVVCHGGHGTLVRSLASGTPVVSVPVAGDMAENGARVQWAGAGLSLPERFLSPMTLRWAVERVLDDPRYAGRARELSEWARRNDGAAAAAGLVEGFAAGAV
jgi:UDP:flavonoid glycosyltransferase YjiC (YdhE family)